MSAPAARGARRGANAIEFALTMPVFLALVLGIMDYGYLYSIQAGLDNAVSLACREGSKIDPGSGGNPQSVAQADLNARSAYFCNGACVAAVTNLSTGAWAIPNKTLRCAITRTGIQPLTGFVPYPTSLSSTSYYRLEWQRNAVN